MANIAVAIKLPVGSGVVQSSCQWGSVRRAMRRGQTLGQDDSGSGQSQW